MRNYFDGLLVVVRGNLKEVLRYMNFFNLSSMTVRKYITGFDFVVRSDRILILPVHHVESKILILRLNIFERILKLSSKIINYISVQILWIISTGQNGVK
jgi:hypothetical protein